MQLTRAPASPPLRSLLRGFEERHGLFAGGCVTHRLPARPDLFLEIYLAERYGVERDGVPIEFSPELALVGPQDRGHTRLLLAGEIRAFSIRFQPGAVHRLARIAMPLLINQGLPAGEVFGPLAAKLRDAVLGAADFLSRVAAAERWIAALAGQVAPPDPIDHAARLLLRAGGQLRIERLAQATGMSQRHFARRFARQVGLSPKFYARTVRLNALFAARQARPAASWAELAHQAGYADQAHFIRECHELAGAAPTAFFPQSALAEPA